MTTTLGINGFGRIGRNVLRALIETGRDDLKVVAINDLAAPETNAHLLEFDSVHGRLDRRVSFANDVMDVGLGPIRVTAERNPADLPWSDVDVVLECTGVFRNAESCQAHLENGSSAVLISAPAKGGAPVPTIVYGINDELITGADKVLSNASCTTNCLAPVAHLLESEFGIKRANFTTVHAYTGSQPTHDRADKDLNRGRAAALSMVPTSTGAAGTTAKVLPGLEGKLIGQAIRVPTPNVSCVDLVAELGKDVTVGEVNAVMQSASDGKLKGVLGCEDRPTVSVDWNHDSHSSVVALNETKVIGGNMVRMLLWYDNEWGFSNRMLDTSAAIGAKL